MLAILPVTVAVVPSSATKGSSAGSPAIATASSSTIGARSRCSSVPSSAGSRSAVGGGSYRRTISSIGSAVEGRSSVTVCVCSIGGSSVGNGSLGDEFRSSGFEAVESVKQKSQHELHENARSCGWLGNGHDALLCCRAMQGTAEMNTPHVEALLPV